MSRGKKRTPLGGGLGRRRATGGRGRRPAEATWLNPEAPASEDVTPEDDGVTRIGSGPRAKTAEPGEAEGVSMAARGGAFAKVVFDKVLDVATIVAGNRYGVAASILVAVAALYGSAALTRPGEPSALKGATVPVGTALAACPAAEQTARLSVVSGGEGQGSASVTALDGKAEGKAVADVPTASALFTGEVKRGSALVVRAEGAVAAGLEAAHTVAGKKGLASAPCTAPSTEHWFVTPGPGAGPLELHVTNVDDVPATIDLDAVSDDGSLDTTDGKSLDVPAHGTRVIKIGESLEGLGMIASDVDVLALRVTATSGRVAAAVRADVGARGADWATPTAEPALRAIVPGVPGGSGKRTLYVGAPGGSDARVTIRAITAEGAFVPEGQDVLDVPARTVIPLDLESSLGGRPATIELTSNRKIVAGFASGGYDLALGGAGIPLDGGTSALGAVVPASGSSGAKKSREAARIVLTAPEKDAVVRVVPLTASGPGTPTEVKIPAGRTVEVPLTEGAVRVTPLAGSGPVYGARLLSLKAGQREQLTVRTLFPAPLEIVLPPVSGSLTSVVP
ncbi:DUF5719 family protein [Actinocorallia sp. A-T 12471]|uniref:DUF5719 family protein n=1 Tax=Actinocorallia sp. A-T 12471 TaxID=3089813 RepID=UPI0029D3167D|nr:DUF5719 family protein [Actinocorallia sp. A-T 12471]MDX6744611.1 DUF5719 family protein [Actinocorallia sp. A-T 12471]